MFNKTSLKAESVYSAEEPLTDWNWSKEQKKSLTVRDEIYQLDSQADLQMLLKDINAKKDVQLLKILIDSDTNVYAYLSPKALNFLVESHKFNFYQMKEFIKTIKRGQRVKEQDELTIEENVLQLVCPKLSNSEDATPESE